MYIDESLKSIFIYSLFLKNIPQKKVFCFTAHKFQLIKHIHFSSSFFVACMNLEIFSNKMFLVSTSPAEGQMIKSSLFLMKFESITLVYAIMKSRS